jgi:mono/diheme cytochrome c family protein
MNHKELFTAVSLGTTHLNHRVVMAPLTRLRSVQPSPHRFFENTEISRVVEEYGRAVEHARAAAFDGVEMYQIFATVPATISSSSDPKRTIRSFLWASREHFWSGRPRSPLWRSTTNFRKQETGNSVPKRRYIAGLSLAAMLILAGCRQDMHDQPKFFPQRGTDFYADGRSARPQVDNTVARGQMHGDAYFYTGMINGAEGNTYPFPVTMDVLQRGQERYNVYCSPCHSRVGNGQGMIVERGYLPAGNYHTERLRNAPLGHFFSVMTNGYGVMPDYAVQLNPADRWAVVAYIKALQLSQNATQADIAPGQHAEPLAEVATREGMQGLDAAWELPAIGKRGHLSSSEAGAPAAQPAPAGPVTSTTATPAAAVASGRTANTPPPPPVPAAPGPEEIATGQDVYAHNCEVCHKKTLAGLPPNIPALGGIVQRTSAAHVRQIVLNGVPTGKPAMPSFEAKLTQDDVEHLIDFLSTTKPLPKTETASRPAQQQQ